MSNLENNVLIYGKTPISKNCFGCYFFQQICPGSVYNVGECGSGDLVSKQQASAILSLLMLNHLDNNTLALHKVLGEDINEIKEKYSEEEIEYVENLDDSKISWLREKFYDENVFLSEESNIHIHEEEKDEVNIQTYLTVLVNTKFFENVNGFAVLNGETTLEDFNKTSPHQYTSEEIEKICNDVGFKDIEILFVRPQYEIYEGNNQNSSFEKIDLSEDPFAPSNVRQVLEDDDDLPF